MNAFSIALTLKCPMFWINVHVESAMVIWYRHRRFKIFRRIPWMPRLPSCSIWCTIVKVSSVGHAAGVRVAVLSGPHNFCQTSEIILCQVFQVQIDRTNQSTRFKMLSIVTCILKHVLLSLLNQVVSLVWKQSCL